MHVKPYATPGKFLLEYEAACREALKKGYDCCTLFVDQKNPVSNWVYEKIGFQILEDAYEYSWTNGD